MSLVQIGGTKASTMISRTLLEEVKGRSNEAQNPTAALIYVININVTLNATIVMKVRRLTQHITSYRLTTMTVSLTNSLIWVFYGLPFQVAKYFYVETF